LRLRQIAARDRGAPRDDHDVSQMSRRALGAGDSLPTIQKPAATPCLIDV